jgi:RNA polymerase sigma-70 factor (ECF subfamily)
LRQRQERVAASESAPDLIRQREVVDAFLAALRAGDFEGLMAVLDPDLVVRAEIPGAAPSESRGAAVWANGAVAYGHMAQMVRPALVNGAVGLALASPQGRVSRTLTFTIANGKISEIDIIGDPARLGELEVSMLE